MALIPVLTSDGAEIFTIDGFQLMVDDGVTPGAGCVVLLPVVPPPQPQE